jgi:hypothetical protein
MKSRLFYVVCQLFFLVCLLVSGCKTSPKINNTPTISPSPIATTKPTKYPTFSPKTVRISEYLPPEEFVGYYTESFEVASFVPCSENDLPGYGKGYWIDIFQNSIFSEEYYSITKEIVSNSNESGEPSEIVFVHFIGQRSNPAFEPYTVNGHKGHMGFYKQEIIVIELLEMKLHKEKKCD